MTDPRVWIYADVHPGPSIGVVHDRYGCAWNRQRDGQWRADEPYATPGRFEDLVRVFGPITEGPPPGAKS